LQPKLMPVAAAEEFRRELRELGYVEERNTRGRC
jgi:hypothetical protein